MEIIGIDIGTTSICGVVTDTDEKRVIKSRTISSNAFIESSYEWEKIQSVDKIMQIAMDILNELVTDKTSAIGVTGQMHGIVYTDKDGNAVSPLYTWQDGRGNLSYKDTTYAGYMKSSSGYGNVTDFYNRENGIRPLDAVSYCTIHDYLVMKLCGLKKPIMHSSDAASLGCYNLKTNTFNYDTDIEVVNDYHIAGEYKGIPVSVAIGDNQASVFSTLADEKNILLNIGTGSQVSVVSENIVTGDDIETRPYFEGKYLIVGAALCGGRAFSMLKDFYGEILKYALPEITEGEIYAIMDKMLEKEEAATVVADTRFAGTRSNVNITGSITNITTQNFTPKQFSLAVLSGIVTELYEMYGRMGEEKCGVVGSGNGLRKNPALIKTAEEKFGFKMKIPCHLEEAALGAGLFGGISAGIYKTKEEAQSLIKYM